MLNIVTERDAYPAAILIRGVEGISGPARVTKVLNIDNRFNGKPSSRETGLWIEDRGVIVSRVKIKRGPRIGIPYAGDYREKPWRFFLSEK